MARTFPRRPSIRLPRTGSSSGSWPTSPSMRCSSRTGVREKVLAAWKNVQARSVAREAAKRLAEKARKAKGPLKDCLKNEPHVALLDPPPFTWVTAEQSYGGPAGRPTSARWRASAAAGRFHARRVQPGRRSNHHRH